MPDSMSHENSQGSIDPEVLIDPNNIEDPVNPSMEYSLQPEEESLTFEQKALQEINNLVERDNQRAAERYKGALNIKLLSRVNQWFNRAGERKIAETIEETGQYHEAKRWRKWAGIGLKIAGGVGAATAMVTTGGAAALTPIIYSEGIRNAIDGALQVVEELKWGKERSEAENGAQCAMTVAIDYFKNEVGREDLTEEQYASAVLELQKVEADLIKQQFDNMKLEKKWNFGRKIVSGIATIATTVINGIPLGREGGEVATRVGETALDSGHRTFWDISSGKTFTYNDAQEVAKVASEASKHGYAWETIQTAFSQTAHTMGQGLSFANKLSLGGALGFTGAKIGLAWPKKEKVVTNQVEEVEEVEDNASETVPAGDNSSEVILSENTPTEDVPSETTSVETSEDLTRSQALEPPIIVSVEPEKTVQPEVAVKSDTLEVDPQKSGPVVEPAVVPIDAPLIVSDVSDPVELPEAQSSTQNEIAPAVEIVAAPVTIPETIETNETAILDQLNLLRDQIRETKNSSKYLTKWFRMKLLQSKYEKIASQIFNQILSQNGNSLDDETLEKTRADFAKKVGLRGTQFKINRNKTFKNISIQVIWNFLN